MCGGEDIASGVVENIPHARRAYRCDVHVHDGRVGARPCADPARTELVPD